ncbi:unnamed protein product [Symbiodinium sp. CCMP2592]|nr:unnamed protein product [Symbiodinium sp. CCMP2592]
MGRPWMSGDPTDDKERAKRLELLADRARRFREELGRRLEGAQREVAEIAEAPLGGLGVAAATVELIEASDPLLAGEKRFPHQREHAEAQHHPTASETKLDPEAEATARRGPVRGSSCNPGSSASPGCSGSVQICIDSAQLAAEFAEMVRTRQHLALKVLLSEETFLVPCCAARDGVLVFSHMSWHPLRSLRSARLQLLAAHSSDCVQTMKEPFASHLVVLATAELPQQVLQSLAHARLELPLQASSGPHESPRFVGSISVSLALSSEEVRAPPMDGALEPSGVHLKVWLEDLCLRLASLNGVFVVLKLGPEQEMVVHVSQNDQRAEGGDLVGRLGFMAVAEHTAWSFDLARKILMAGPNPEKLFFQVWSGQELLGLAGLEVPPLDEDAMNELAERGRPCVELLAVELPVQATSNGETIGSLRTKILAEFTSQRRVHSTVAAVAKEAEIPEEHRQAPGELAAQGCIELSAPLSDREVATWFRHFFAHHLAESLHISPDRIRVIRLDGRTLVFEIAPGPRHEAPAKDALAELGRQLAVREGPVWHTDLAKLLAEPMDAEGPRSERPPTDSGERERGFSQRGTGPGWGPRAAAVRAERTELMGNLQQRLFEVVHASGVEVSKAFTVLDTNRDGLVEITDMVALLSHLGLPLPEDLLHLAGHLSKDEGCQVDLLEFCRHFAVWQSARPPPALAPAPAPPPSAWEALLLPQGARAERCLLLPTYFLYALLDPEATGRVSPETWLCVAQRCLGFGADAAAATYGFCDQHGIGALTYRDFRRYVHRVDELRAQRLPPEACLPIYVFRQDVRATLELADTTVTGPTEPVNRLAAVAASLQRRGRELDHEVNVSGLEELLSDLRLSPQLAAHMLEWQESIAAAVWASRGKSAQPSLTYRGFLSLLRRAHALVQSHLDGLLRACLVAGADLQVVLSFALVRPNQALSAEELAGSLAAAGVDLASVDPQDVLLALDPHCCKQIYAPDLIQSFETFRAKFGSMLSSIAGQLGRRGLSPDQLFPAAVLSQRGG